MKSKLDIIDDVIEAKEPVPENITIDAFIQFKAMDLYAKEVAIEFLQFAVNNFSVDFEGFSLNKYNNGKEPTVWVNHKEVPLSELFNQFTQSLNKEEEDNNPDDLKDIRFR